MSTPRTICNWKDYNEALVKRGALIFRFDVIDIESLFYQDKQKRGGKRKYSPRLYEYLLTLKVTLRLSWRATLGFASSVLTQAFKKPIELPHYAHAARSANQLNFSIKTYFSKERGEGLTIALDSTGVNVYSTSGYHQRKYRKDNLYRKREQWKKIHLAVDLQEQQILSMVYTKSTVNDCEVVAQLSQAIKERIASVTGDGAYDTEATHKTVHDRDAQAIIPPAITAKAQSELKNKKSYKDYLKQRDDIIHRIRQAEDFTQGLKQWKKASGYHKRSLVETCFFRLKRIFGFHFQQKTEQGRKNEMIAKINLLNAMTWLGTPRYCEV